MFGVYDIVWERVSFRGWKDRLSEGLLDVGTSV